jgi:hypothetical protein
MKSALPGTVLIRRPNAATRAFPELKEIHDEY